MLHWTIVLASLSDQKWFQNGDSLFETILQMILIGSS